MSDSLAHKFSPSRIRSQVQYAVDSVPKPEPAAKAETSAAETSLPDKADPLPKAGDPYKVAGRHGNKPDLTIHFVTKDYSYEGFSYADLERVRLVRSENPGSGPVLVVRFNGSVVTEVTIQGRHLNSLYHWIGLHRLPWIAEHPSPADFADKNAAVISKITIDSIDR
jgi:hypothetical protein